MNEIQFKAPDGATHYYRNKFTNSYSYWFYSNDVKMWFVWDKYWEYWSSKVFIERIEDLKELSK